MPRTLGFLIALVLTVSVGAQQRTEAEQKAIDALLKFGCKLAYVQDRPEMAVIRASFEVSAAAPQERKATDAELKHIGQLKALQELYLGNTRVTDAGLKELKDLQELNRIHLEGTAITDAGLKELKGLRKLKHLQLSKTQVTDAGVEDLKKALPTITIVRSSIW